MKASIARPKSIDEYIHRAPLEVQEKLHQLRACILSAAPGATESIKWGMPALSYKRILVMFAGFKNHIGFYPTPSAVKAFKKDLARYKISTTAIQFPLDKPLPLGLIRKITKFRVRESVEEDKRWMSNS